jgi:hypothetical protein
VMVFKRELPADWRNERYFTDDKKNPQSAWNGGS